LARELGAFREFGARTLTSQVEWRTPEGVARTTPLLQNEFWTSRQRAAHSLHEISYRACFKPQLPRFFIERLTAPGDVVHDPFMGRGTTPLEAALLGRTPYGSDLNPLSRFLVRPRLAPPSMADIQDRLARIPRQGGPSGPEDLLVFFHPETLGEICALRHYLLERRATDALDEVDEWLAMVALNRLTGHSTGFFSVYTLPPNQAVSVKSQRRINERRAQVPPRRKVADLILRKSRQLFKDCTMDEIAALRRISGKARLWTAPARETPGIADESVDLVVTSPPFLNVVNYTLDNWMRCWFAGIETDLVQLTTTASLDAWQEAMTQVLLELRRVLRPGGHVAFEVGEVRKGSLLLETAVLPCGWAAGLEPELVLVNAQNFTKTANCWGVGNNAKGTNSNRVVLLRARGV